MTIHIMSPQLERLATLPSPEVEAWLAAQGRVGKRLFDEAIVAVPKEHEQLLLEAEEGGIPVLLVGLGGTESLVRQLDHALREKGRLILFPVQRARAHYHSPRQFFAGMEQLAARLPEAEMFLPAGVYGERRVKRPKHTVPLRLACGFQLIDEPNPD